MVTRAMCLFAALLGTGPGWANVYRVRNTHDSGTDSLRWAIQRANQHSGQDTILFTRAMVGQTIEPLSPLPTITDDYTTINGDMIGDDKPHIAVNCHLQGQGDGLTIHADSCSVTGLAIYYCPGWGIVLLRARDCRISRCHVGANLPGDLSLPNGEGDIQLRRSHENLIGGTSAGHGNVISAGRPYPFLNTGIQLLGCHRNCIMGNLIGLTADGMDQLGTGGVGISLMKFDTTRSNYNKIGGTRPWHANLFAGLQIGVHLSDEARGNTVTGSAFGLCADGDTPLTMVDPAVGVFVTHGATQNRIGGPRPADRNAFAGFIVKGIAFQGAATTQNTVQSNYFGTNYWGTRALPLQHGVWIDLDAGAQEIGGATRAQGNYFCNNSTAWTSGVRLIATGKSTLIKRNTFGLLPNGDDVPQTMDYGVYVNGVSVSILSNKFANVRRGIRASGAGANPQVYGNRFTRCRRAVYIDSDARCRLGNLGNARSDDDGENRFRLSNHWHIYNGTPNSIKAEGNAFGTTSREAIGWKIRDRRYNRAIGRVDFVPLMGGVIPTGGVESVLTVSGLYAASTDAGSQITFSLSAPAQVQARILNIAGRPIKTLCHARDYEAGTNTLLWNAMSDRGLPVPNGTYLVDMTAKAADGEQVRGLGQLTVGP